MKNIQYYLVGILLLLHIIVKAQSIQQVSATPSQGGDYGQTTTYKHECVVGGVSSGIITNPPYNGSSIGFLYTSQNLPPTANAGADQIVMENSTVTLTGVASSDPEGSPLSYSWTSLDGITLSGTAVVNPTFTAPIQLAQRKYRFKLEVSDGLNSSNVDTIVITIRDVNWQPVVYTTSCALIALPTFSGVYADIPDVVGAFSSTGECRGVQEVVIINAIPYVIFNVQLAAVELISFKIYDYSANQVCNVPGTFSMSPQGSTGTPQNPLLLDAQCLALSTGTINGTPFCAGASLNVSANIVGGGLNTGNTFTAQLSDASGSFANPVVIGSIAGTSSSTIAAQIPANTPAGTAYRVRVVSSNPVSIGTDNGTNITINSSVITPTITTNATAMCVGGSLTLTNSVVGTTGTYTRQWQSSTDGIVFTNISAATASTYTATLNTVGTYYYRLAISKTGQCSGYSNVTVVTVAPDPVVTATGSTAVCGSGTATFTANPQNGVGTNTLTWEQFVSSWGTVATGVNTYIIPTPLSATRSYRAKLVSTGNGCTTAYSSNVTLTVNPLPSVVTTPATTTTICTGGGRTLVASGANSYAWTGTNLNTSTGATVIATPTATTTYSVVGTNTATGCAKSANVVVNVVADPTVVISGTNNVCVGNSTNLTAIVSGGTGTFTYQWQWGTNGTTFPNIGASVSTTSNSNIYATPVLNSTVYYRVFLVCNGTGCTTSSYSQVYQLNVAPLPQITLSATTPICTGGNSTLTANLVGGVGSCPFFWEKSTDGGVTWTSATTLTTATYTTSTLTATTQYRVSVNCTGLGCGATTSNVVQVTVNADPSITASPTGATTFCGSGTPTFNANPLYGAGSCTLTWEQFIGGVWVSIASGPNPYTTSPITTSSTFRAKITCSGSGCGAAASANMSVTINPLPNLTTNPLASGNICTGGNVTMVASGANTYSWSPNTNLTSTTTASVVASPTSTTTYTVIGTNTTNGCTKSANIVVNVQPDPTVVISGDNAVCIGGNANLAAIITGGTGTFTYQWQSSSNGTSFVNIVGATLPTHTATAISANTYYRVSITCNGVGCSTPVSSPAFLVSTSPLPQLTLIGTSPICTGGTSTLNVAITGGLGNCPFSWQQSTNGGASWTSATPNNVNSYTTLVLTASTQYKVLVSCTGNGCGTATSNTFEVLVNPDPIPTVTGNLSICSGTTTTLTANVVGGAGLNSFQWYEYVNPAFNPITVNGTNSTYTTLNLTSGKTYRYTMTSAGSGCNAATSPNATISILTLPTVTLTGSNPIDICEGGIRTITITGNATTYSWSGTGLNSYSGTSVIFTPSSGGSYSHTVYGTAANGCVKSVSTTTNVVSDPSITISGPTTILPNATANLTANWTGGAGIFTLKWQWRIPPATNWTDIANSTATVTGANTYSYTSPAFTGARDFRAALLASASGCGGTGTAAALVYSPQISIIAQSPPSRTTMNESVLVFPNPAQTEITVQVTKPGDSSLNFEITNSLGQSIVKWDGNVEKGLYEKVIPLDKFVEGIYYIRVSYSDGTFETIKFVKEGTNRD
jgi:hypothetical protein